MDYIKQFESDTGIQFEYYDNDNSVQPGHNNMKHKRWKEYAEWFENKLKEREEKSEQYYGG